MTDEQFQVRMQDNGEAEVVAPDLPHAYRRRIIRAFARAEALRIKGEQQSRRRDLSVYQEQEAAE